jgi:polar amino acid transport system permease protein
VETIAEWFQWLHQAHGINFSVFHDAFDRARFFRAIGTTIQLSAVSIVASIVLGVIGAWLQSRSSRTIRLPMAAYIQFFRNTPPLVQMYFFYFALGPTLSNLFGSSTPILGSFAWATISLSFYAAAFNVEIFRSGLEAVPKSTVEAAESLGFSPAQVYRNVLFPLALRFSLPALTSNIINLTKTTTLAYAIAVPEALFVANQIWSDSINVLEMMLVLLLVYHVIVGLIAAFASWLERRLQLPGYGA